MNDNSDDLRSMMARTQLDRIRDAQIVARGVTIQEQEEVIAKLRGACKRYEAALVRRNDIIQDLRTDRNEWQARALAAESTAYELHEALAHLMDRQSVEIKTERTRW